MLYKNTKLEERSDQEPKFDPKNKTDRKIMWMVIISVSVLVVLIAGLITIYYLFFHGGSGGSSIIE